MPSPLSTNVPWVAGPTLEMVNGWPSGSVSLPTRSAAVKVSGMWSRVASASATAVGASFWSVSTRSKLSVVASPPASVDVTVTVTPAPSSKLSDTPSFSFNWPSTTSKRVSSTV